MTTPTPIDHVPTTARRRRSVRRAAGLTAAAVVIGAPLVAQALGDDPVAELAAQRPASAAVGSFLSTRSPSLTTWELNDRPDPTSMRQAERLDPPTSPEPAPDAEQDADRDAEVRALLLATYTWDEQSARVAELQEVLEVTADGRYGPATRAAHLRVLDFAGLPTSGVPDQPLPDGTTAEQWASLRECESGGDYTIVSSGGTYRGAYQFNRSTWDSVASQYDPSLVGVDPADASPADQDAMAYALYRERGWQPWPTCGRNL